MLLTTNQQGKMAYIFWEQPEDVSTTLTATFGVLDLASQEVIFEKNGIDYGYFISKYTNQIAKKEKLFIKSVDSRSPYPQAT